MYPCIYMQGWFHDGEHLHVCSCDFELQQVMRNIHKAYRVATIVEY